MLLLQLLLGYSGVDFITFVVVVAVIAIVVVYFLLMLLAFRGDTCCRCNDLFSKQ